MFLTWTLWATQPWLYSVVITVRQGCLSKCLINEESGGIFIWVQIILAMEPLSFSDEVISDLVAFSNKQNYTTLPVSFCCYKAKRTVSVSPQQVVLASASERTDWRHWSCCIIWNCGWKGQERLQVEKQNVLVWQWVAASFKELYFTSKEAPVC